MPTIQNITTISKTSINKKTTKLQKKQEGTLRDHRQ